MGKNRCPPSARELSGYIEQKNPTEKRGFIINNCELGREIF